MNEEIKKIKEEYKNRGRSARRKKERELQKKYNDKSIRLEYGKQFNKDKESLTRAERRKLASDKDLIKEVVKIIRKYIPNLEKMLSRLTDKRHKSYITYNIRTLIMTRLFALICGITTMNEMTRKFNTDKAIKNLSVICNQNLTEVPNWQTIQDVIEELDENEVRNIRKYIVKALIRSKMFDGYRYDGKFQLLVDATGVSSHDYNLNGNCLCRKIKGTNKIKYYKQVLEAKIVVGKIVISLDTEWIENTNMNTEKQKQDCEIKAFKRMAPRIKKEFPKMKFIITGDALYATTPMINICTDNKWDYIFNLKKDRLKNVYEEFEDNVNYKNETTKENYSLSNNIEFKGNIFNALKFVEITEKKTTVFNYITNLKVTNHNIEKIVDMGRRRWKIENEGFNEQKNGTFNISHLCSRNENALRIHYYLIQIAHIIRQLLELGSKKIKEMKVQTKKEISENLTNTLISKIVNLNYLKLNFQLRFSDCD